MQHRFRRDHPDARRTLVLNVSLQRGTPLPPYVVSKEHRVQDDGIACVRMRAQEDGLETTATSPDTSLVVCSLGSRSTTILNEEATNPVPPC